MRFCKLRIAFSATCLVASVLLIVLWVRSYTTTDLIQLGSRDAQSVFGRLLIYGLDPTPGMEPDPFAIDSHPIGDKNYEPGSWNFSGEVLGFRWESGNGHWHLTVPDWAALLLTVALAAAPWIKWRFSLRTLLIATTLVAVLLGLIFWFSR